METNLQKTLLKMSKYVIYCLILQSSLYSFAMSHNSIAQGKKLGEVGLNISCENSSLIEVFENIEKATDFTFAYRPNEIPNVQITINPKTKSISLEDILLDVARQGGVSFRRLDKTIHVRKNNGDNEHLVEIVRGYQSVRIGGKVTDESGEPLPGATVLEKGTNNGTATNVNGEFSLSVSENAVIVISFIGYLPEEIQVGNQTNFDISLIPDISNLEEVVVIGYGTQKKETLTGAVSSIETKELIQSPVANISNSLAGRLPGLMAIQTSREPGYDQSELRIRGTATYAGSSSPLVLVDGVERSFNNIDPNEIETISVLKDASATAVYGVRGANGVIIITTKTGQTGKPQISYSSSFGFQQITKFPELLNSYEYASLRNEAELNENPDADPYFSDEALALYKSGEDPYFHPDIDWFDLVLKKITPQQQHNFNISGGTKDTKYFISLGYFDQEGIYDVDDMDLDFSANPRYQRYNLRSNFDINFNENFKGSIKLGGQFSNSNYPGTSASDIFFTILTANPLMSPAYIDGKLISSVEGLPSSSGNPLQKIVNNGYQQNFTGNLTTNISLEHKLDFITKGLKIKGMFSYDNYYGHNVYRYKGVETYKIIKDEEGNPVFVREGEDEPFSFDESYSRSRRAYMQSSFEYARSFGRNNFSGLVLFTQEKYTEPYQEYQVPEAYQGLVGRVTYNYDEKYLLEFNMGYNGSEQFPEGSRFGFFPAVSAGWVATSEPFIHTNKIFSYLKIRGSYGEVGNDKLGSGDRFLYLEDVFYQNSGGYYFGSNASGAYQWYDGAQEGRIGNPNVVWERARKANIGFESGFFDDNLQINFDYFFEKRDNILSERQTVPSIVQADLPAVNLGKVENKGFEVEVNYNNKVGSFNYWVKSNYSFARNKILFMDEPERAYPWLKQTGKRINQPFGLESDGFYDTEEELADAPSSTWTSELHLGDIKYVDQNDDGVIDDNDRVPIGNPRFPEIMYGVSFGGTFKGFDFSVLFQGAENTSAYFSEMAAWAFDTDWRNATKRHLERWTPERYAAGEKITYPRVMLSPTQGNHNYTGSDFWQEDASYLRLKNVEVAYNFRNGFFQKAGISDIRVYVNGNNLITWSKMKIYDPEAPTGRGEFYPQMRVYNVGVNVKF